MGFRKVWLFQRVFIQESEKLINIRIKYILQIRMHIQNFLDHPHIMSYLSIGILRIQHSLRYSTIRGRDASEMRLNNIFFNFTSQFINNIGNKI